MKNWDDIRIFLAVAREGSIRRAATSLKINHSTVSRRLSAFEEELNVRFFERMSTGYLLTTAGEDLLSIAQNIEDKVAVADRNLLGRDNRMSGTLKVSLPTALSTSILIKEFATFCDLYPDVDLQLIHSYELADLGKRDADVAIRITNTPPETLIGRKVVSMYSAVYISKEYWQKINDENNPTTPRWLSWSKRSEEDSYIKESIFPNAPQLNFTTNPDAMKASVKAGIGISSLACMIGDADSELMRLPPGIAAHHFDVWVLTHNDLRHTLRIKTFMDFTVKVLKKYKNRLEGVIEDTDH
ncbi:MAG: LysR family transcriptional regulator [Alphaproteobacteria bacterium]|nr:MAG: LysR family transcriptional regulator [Alphaproteobacteria bacterium]